MSLDITLFSEKDGEEVYSVNITHNLTAMAERAGLYQVMWHPEELKIIHASEAVPFLEAGIKKMEEKQFELEELNPKNSWGNYHTLLRVAKEYLETCKLIPNTCVRVCR